ncbi:MAG: bacteriohemerythrin [Melioribacteraceae bacterium]|nr:bacteriohemerythrin [Melioribacteraceae bacterium]
MSFLDWNDEAILNHPTLDKEHKKMVDDTNKLYSYVVSKKNKKANELFFEIIENLQLHFETEDRLMKESKIPLYISHKLEHERFLSKISSLQKSIDAGKEILSVEHLKLVKTWFYNHMKFKDRALAEFLIKHNIQ